MNTSRFLLSLTGFVGTMKHATLGEALRAARDLTGEVIAHSPIGNAADLEHHGVSLRTEGNPWRVLGRIVVEGSPAAAGVH
jgi:hypothetical protein